MSGAFHQAHKAAGTVKVVPVPLRKELAPCGPYPTAALGPVAGPAVDALAARVQVPEAMAAHSVLAAVAVAVQGHLSVRLPTQEIKPASIFLCTVADSGDRKTAVDKLACAPIEEFEAELHEQYALEKQVYDAQYSVWKSAKEAIIKECKGRDPDFIRSEIEGHGPPPNAPLLPSLIVPPGSTQGVIYALEHGRPSAGLFHNDGGAWLGSYGMQDENLTATITAYSELWDGKAIKTLTKGEGLKYLPGRAFSFHVMFQAIYVGRMFGNIEMREQGFLARMLSVQPESIAGTRFKDVNAIEPDGVARAIADYHDRLRMIIRAPLPIDFERNNALDRKIAEFSPEATSIYWEFYNSIEAQLGKDGPLREIRGMASKAAENAGRLAAIIHVFRVGLRPPVIIDADAMACGCTLMNFYLGEILRLSSQGEDDEATMNAESVSKLLEGWERDQIGLSEIQDKSRLGRRLKAAGLREVCRVLEAHDHITKIEGGAKIGDRHHKEAWRIHVGR